MNRFNNVLCIIELSEAFEPALKRAIALAGNNQAALTVVDVVEHIPLAAGTSYDGLNPTTLQAEITCVCTTRLKGWPRKEIPLLAKQINADLIVMGTVGNTAESILNQIDCSVMAIKPSEFVTQASL